MSKPILIRGGAPPKLYNVGLPNFEVMPIRDMSWILSVNSNSLNKEGEDLSFFNILTSYATLSFRSSGRLLVGCVYSLWVWREHHV